MRLYKKHPKPKDQEPSSKLIEYANEIEIPEMPIADVACGYGRNGAYFASQNIPVIFIDMDQDCLNFICKGKDVSITGDIPPEQIKCMNVDLTEKWPLPPNSLSGIICTHFYYPGLITQWSKSIVKNGFIYFETIEARKANENVLPWENEIRKELEREFDILHYSERTVKNTNQFPQRKVSCLVFAVKK